jgi:catechol 2,3-dioxygenase-like lactoylglutathione lyase family enzyme
MTQIGGFKEAVRRPGVLGVHSLDHFALTVPDAAQAAEFYNAFGLDARAEHGGVALRTHGGQHRWGMLQEGRHKKLQYLSFGAYEDDLPRFRERLRQMGVELLPSPAGLESNGVWLRDPNGLPIEIRVAEKTSPSTKSRFEAISSGANERGANMRSTAPTTRIRRLAHVVMHTSDVARSIEFYTKVLGLRLSDESGGVVAFLHGVHGSDHHMIAFAQSHGLGLHHCSWDVGSVQEVGLGAMQMAERGYTAGWGLGRHVLGSNYFHYVRDPWGSYAEYSADMDFISADADWDTVSHKLEDASYLWGPKPPEDFGRNYEVES